MFAKDAFLMKKMEIENKLDILLRDWDWLYILQTKEGFSHKTHFYLRTPL